MADCSEATVEYSFSLMHGPTVDEYVTTATRVLPPSMFIMLTRCVRNDFIRSAFIEPTLPDMSSTKTTSVAQSCAGAATAFYELRLLHVYTESTVTADSKLQ